MEIHKILAQYGKHPRVKELGRLISSNSHRRIQVQGLYTSAAPLAFSSLVVHSPEALNKPFCFILGDQEEAGYFYHDIVQFLGDKDVLFLPSSYKRAIKFGQIDSANEILRTEVLGRLVSNSLPLFIITYPEALAELVVTKSSLAEQTLLLNTGEKVDASFVQETLISYGFQRVDYVYEPGQFSVRGSLIDVFSYSAEYPYRIDFWGDEVDSIRTFEVDSQTSISKIQSISIIPSLSSDTVSRENILSFLPSDTVLIMHSTVDVCDIISRAYEEGFCRQAIIEDEVVNGANNQESKILERDKLLVNPDEFVRKIPDFAQIILSNKPLTENNYSVVRFNISPQPIFHKNFELVFDSFHEYLDKGYSIYILADSVKQTDRLESIFHEQQADIQFTPVERTIHEGFADNDQKVCYFTDHQIFDRFHKYNLKSDKARTGKLALSLKEIQQFKIGDFVVHIDHGIGRFGGLIRIPQGDKYQEAIKIIYENNAAVFVSIHSLHKVSKYKSKDGDTPRISTLGTGAWERMKDRTKKKIKDIARDLIKLYSRRREEKGFAFSPDTFLQHELEASFLYEDTPDQLKATNAVKGDMEKSRPMDRLVCGDVGFGKTEVAIRAAFKACVDNKQVAVLVPTTVLAYQHFRSFSERLRDMPVRVDYLSRARNAQKTKAILQDLKDGKIDILIGTHKLIGKSVRFHDLGLLIIDEEQKFGVSTKEKLRQMKTNVDTLTLTATPIPRTLQFSLMGARDFSVIQTPPPNRYPIQTQVCTFSGEIIAEAINFEMSRNGQVFLVSNRISSLPELAELIHKHIPDARVAIGHGQMPPEDLENIIMDFVNFDYDVLVCTTIIESGIDIPNVNTIIINSAQNFGLSDLHQMRGRVGRSNKKAFCYLLAPPLSALNQDARRRLQAIENFSDLGSGFLIAMQDLDIRGAGNLLGAEQSGFIADLGYEAYQKILSQAVKELRNDEFADMYAQDVASGVISSGNDFVDECQIESDLQMFFPESYVPTSSERMLLYRELDGLEREEDVTHFRERLIDRFGPIPQEGEALIQVVSLRRLGKYFGAEKIFLKGGKLRLHFVSDEDSPFFQSNAFGQIISFSIANQGRCSIEDMKGKRSFLVSRVNSVQEAVSILKQIQQCSNG